MDNLSVKEFSESVIKKFNSTTSHLEKFLSLNTKQSTEIKSTLKYMYDYLKQDKNLPQGDGLPELILDNFGHEEIWSQLELENESLYFRFITDISKILSIKSSFSEDVVESESELSQNDDVSIKELQLDQNSTSSDSDDDSSNENADNQSNVSEKAEENVEENGVQDKFFSMKEMENFLNIEDQKEMNSAKKSRRKSADSDDSDSIDLFENSDDEDNNNYENLRYDQFFNSSKTDKKMSENSNEDAEEEEEEEDEKDMSDMEENGGQEENDEQLQPSTLELRQGRLQKKIGHLENAALEDKTWQLKGEITADSRPQNSLLEEILEFDVTAKPKIVITEQTNMRLEDIILQRIKDKAWDSVQRKVKPVDDPLEFKKKLALDSEKSKQSLAQIYENEYIKQKETLDPEFNTKPDEEPPEKIKTTAMITNLFSKLDALSHFYFTPRIIKPEAKIVSNLPAISMEEVAPVAVSDATLLAPEEVRPKKKGVPMAKAERTTTDKKRERRFKKIKQHKRRLEQDAKTSLNTGEPQNKRQAKEQTSNILKQVTKDRNISVMETSNVRVGKSSESFFSQLQDQVKNHVSAKIQNGAHKKDKNRLTAKKLKL